MGERAQAVNSARFVARFRSFATGVAMTLYVLLMAYVVIGLAWYALAPA